MPIGPLVAGLPSGSAPASVGVSVAPNPSHGTVVGFIVEGRQPNSLIAEALTRQIEMPLEWRSQKAVLNVQ